MSLYAPEIEGYVRSAEEWRIFNLVEAWNSRGAADEDVDGELEAELQSLGFETRTRHLKPRRDLLWHDPEDWTLFFGENSIYFGGRDDRW